MPTTHYVSPNGGKRRPADQRAPVATLRFQDAIDRAAPGDRIQLLAGVYDEPVIIKNKRNGDAPITIEGTGQTTLDGRRNSVRPRDSDDIDEADYAFIRIVGSQGVIIENMTIQNVWPSAIFIGDSQDIAIRGLNLNGATYGVFAKGPTTKGILVERCAWLQDPTIWDQVAWSEIHDPPTPRRELDGDFFRSWQIAGDVVIRNNYISHAFNGVHLFAVGKTLDALIGKINHNVWIYENTFVFIRDNAVEAEAVATDWFVFANRVLNCHVWLSMETCRGGWWSVFGNRIWFDRKPGPAWDCHTGGGVIKADKVKKAKEDALMPTGPFHYFNNSMYLRSPYIKKGKLRHFRHFANAIQFAKPEHHREGVVPLERAMFAPAPPAPRCDGDAAPDEPFSKEWERLDISFSGDVCDHPHYPVKLVADGWRVSGVAGNPGFESAREGSFGLTEQSLCAAVAPAETVALWEKRKAWRLPAGRNIGAVERNRAANEKDDAPFTASSLGCPRQPPIAPYLIASAPAA